MIGIRGCDCCDECESTMCAGGTIPTTVQVAQSGGTPADPADADIVYVPQCCTLSQICTSGGGSGNLAAILTALAPEVTSFRCVKEWSYDEPPDCEYIGYLGGVETFTGDFEQIGTTVWLLLDQDDNVWWVVERVWRTDLSFIEVTITERGVLNAGAGSIDCMDGPVTVPIGSASYFPTTNGAETIAAGCHYGAMGDFVLTPA